MTGADPASYVDLLSEEEITRRLPTLPVCLRCARVNGERHACDRYLVHEFFVAGSPNGCWTSEWPSRTGPWSLAVDNAYKAHGTAAAPHDGVRIYWQAFP